MKVIKKFLMKVKGYREGNILTVKDASKAKMQLLLGDRKDSKGRISDMIKKGRSDVFVYYSGHGIPGMKEGKGYLVPIDASPDKPNLTCYSLETFFLNLKKLKAKHITVVIDACFSGMSPRNKMLIKDASPAMLKTSKTLPSGTEELTLFTASQPDEIASWNNKANLSLFTSYWIKGLVGNADKDRFGDENGVITIKELKRYLKEKVTYEARKRYGRSQHPQVKYDKNKSLIRLSD